MNSRTVNLSFLSFCGSGTEGQLNCAVLAPTLFTRGPFRCQPGGLLSGKACLGPRIPFWDADPHVDDEFRLAAGRRPQFCSRWTSPQGCLCVFMPWQLASPGVSDLRERQSHVSFMTLTLQVTRCHSHSILLHRPALPDARVYIQVGRDHCWEA